MLMNKRTKAKLIKNIENAAAGLGVLVLVWVICSWVNVLNHNTVDQQYAWWNAFELFAKWASKFFLV